MIETIEASQSCEINSFPSAGQMLQMGSEYTTLGFVWRSDKPSERAGTVWPIGMLAIPLRIISATVAAELSDTASYPATSAGMAMKMPIPKVTNMT